MDRILIIRLSSLGDIVLTQPVTVALKRKYPAAELSYLTKAQFVPIVEAMGTIDRIIAYSGSRTVFPRQRFDLAIDLHDKLSTWLLRQQVKATRTVEYDKKHLLRQLIVWHLSRASIPSTLSLYATVLRKIGFGEEEVRALPKPALRVRLSGVPPVDIAGTGHKLIALFPGAAHETKMYPLAQWLEVIRSADDNYRFLLLGSPAEEHLCHFLSYRCPEKTMLPGCHLGLAELIRVIGACDLVLSNDSGPMHLAAALGKKQVALFGATHPRLGFSPMNDNAVVLCRDLDCQPCSLHGGHACPKGHFGCMTGIPAEKILGLIDQMLGDQ